MKKGNLREIVTIEMVMGKKNNWFDNELYDADAAGGEKAKKQGQTGKKRSYGWKMVGVKK